MKYKVEALNSTIIDKEINLTSSKSESNRALIIQAICDKKINLLNLAEAQDTQTLKKSLENQSDYIDIGPAGTTMRFLTAFLSTKKGRDFTLTGSKRMKERPIYPLVDALISLGASIEYLEKKGYPPIKITGKRLLSNKVYIKGDISSQFITAILLIAPSLPSGLELIIEGELVSKPYILMTLNMMKYFGVESEFKNNKILISKAQYIPKELVIEGDWSSASYIYSICALSEKASIKIIGLKEKSLQGDSEIANIMESFNVKTNFYDNHIVITKDKPISLDYFSYDFSNCPDLAQTIAVICASLNINAKLSGLSTLKIKETDRIQALVNELSKLGIKSFEENNSLIIKASKLLKDKEIDIETYEDHRMAMAFAPLAAKIDKINILEPLVVKKSYPRYWEDLSLLGFDISEVK